MKIIITLFITLLSFSSFSNDWASIRQTENVKVSKARVNFSYDEDNVFMNFILVIKRSSYDSKITLISTDNKAKEYKVGYGDRIKDIGTTGFERTLFQIELSREDLTFFKTKLIAEFSFSEVPKIYKIKQKHGDELKRMANVFSEKVEGIYVSKEVEEKIKQDSIQRELDRIKNENLLAEHQIDSMVKVNMIINVDSIELEKGDHKSTWVKVEYRDNSEYLIKKDVLQAIAKKLNTRGMVKCKNMYSWIPAELIIQFEDENKNEFYFLLVGSATNSYNARGNIFSSIKISLAKYISNNEIVELK